MRHLFTLFAALFVAGYASAQDYNLISGHPIPVRLISEVVSDKHVHTTPSAIVDANITDKDGNILIRRGSNVKLNVETMHHKGLGKPGTIAIHCMTTTAVDGQTIYLMGGIAASGRDREELALGLGIGGGIVVFPVGFFCLCIKGEDAHIPSNTMLTNVVVDDNYSIRY